MNTKKLTIRQHNLKNWLKNNFVSGKYFSIEEICNADIGYVLNKDPKIHDKCRPLGYDVTQLNYKTGVERYIPIIKDKKGGIKLVENKDELDTYIKEEKDKLEKKYQYLNHLVGVEKLDGTVPVVNLAGRALAPEETKVVKVYYASEETRD